MNTMFILVLGLAFVAVIHGDDDEAYEYLVHLFQENEHPEKVATSPDDSTATHSQPATTSTNLQNSASADDVTSVSADSNTETPSSKDISTTDPANSSSAEAAPKEPQGVTRKKKPNLAIIPAVRRCEERLLEHCMRVTCPLFCESLKSEELQKECKEECTADKRCAIRIPFVGSTGSADEVKEEAKWEKENKRKSEANQDLDSYRTHYIGRISNEALDAQNFAQIIHCIAEKRDREGTITGRDMTPWKEFKTDSYLNILLRKKEIKLFNDGVEVTKVIDTNHVKDCEILVIQHCKTTTCPKLCEALSTNTLRNECSANCKTVCERPKQKSMDWREDKFGFNILLTQNAKQVSKCTTDTQISKDSDEWKSFETYEYVKASTKSTPIQLPTTA